LACACGTQKQNGTGLKTTVKFAKAHTYTHDLLLSQPVAGKLEAGIFFVEQSLHTDGSLSQTIRPRKYYRLQVKAGNGN